MINIIAKYVEDLRIEAEAEMANLPQDSMSYNFWDGQRSTCIELLKMMVIELDKMARQQIVEAAFDSLDKKRIGKSNSDLI